MIDAIHGLTVNGTPGFQMSSEGGWIRLDGPREQLEVQVATINLALDDTLQRATDLITAALQTLTLAAVATEFTHRLADVQYGPLEHAHAL